MRPECPPELKREGLMREVIRNVQQARKAAGLEVDDRIALHLQAENGELQALLTDTQLLQTILDETLAERFSDHELQTTSLVKVEGAELTISLAKV